MFRYVLFIWPTLVFGQMAPNSVTVTSSRNATAAPDQAVISVSVNAATTASLDDAVAALQGEEYVLACPPHVEAAIYAASNAPESNLYPLIPQIQQPVTIIRAGRQWSLDSFDLTASPTAPALAAHFPHGRDVLLEGRNHYIPMETPELVAREIAALLD